MKTFLTCCFILLIGLARSNAQFSESFTDSNLNANPVWQGDTSHFRINQQLQLQLQAPAGSGTSIVATTSRAIHLASWEWWMQLDFNPSSANYADVYLCSNRPELDSALRGYFVRIGNTTDEVSLYRQTGNTRTEIIDGIDGLLDKNTNRLRIRVERDAHGWWQLKTDTTGTGHHFRLEGSVLDAQHGQSQWFGLRLLYSATRANHFFFDDFVANGSAVPDTIAPRLTAALLQPPQAINLHFSKIIGPQERLRLSAYELVGQGRPFRAQTVGDSAVKLEWLLPFAHPAWLEFDVRLFDSAGNALDTSIQLLHHRYTAGQLKINELLADPSPVAGLPETEFVELVNTDSFDVSLAGWVWADPQVQSPLPPLVLAPGEHLLLVPRQSAAAWNGFGKVAELHPWPSLNNDRDDIWLFGPDGTASDSLFYEQSWLGTSARMQGGYTLERVDLQSGCMNGNNWQGSNNPIGGTPGQTNSVAGKIAIQLIPELLLVRLELGDTLNLQFSQAVGGGHLYIAGEKMALPQGRLRSNWRLALPPNLATLDSFTIVLDDIRNCASQAVSATYWHISKPRADMPSSPVFSEIYYRPADRGTAYVELYNAGETSLPLNQLWLAQLDAQNNASQSQVLGLAGDWLTQGSYLVLCRDTAALQLDFGHIPPYNRRQLTSSLGILSSGGRLALLRANGEFLATTTYHDSLHHPLLAVTKGRALEKITGQWESNWGSSPGMLRGSPGRPNNRMLVDRNGKRQLSLNKTIIRPFDLEPLVLTLQTDKPLLAELSLWTTEGREIGILMPQILIEGEHALTFDGTWQKEVLATGSYVIMLKYFHPDGESGFELNQVVINNLSP